MRKSSKKTKQTKRAGFKPNAVSGSVVVILVVLLGLAYLHYSKAAAPNVAFEAESGVATSAATKVSDTGASGTNNNVVQFGTVSPPTGSCPTGQTGNPPNCVNITAPTSTGKTWQQTFSEEFNGTSFDTNKLTPCFDWNYASCTGSFNHGREWYNIAQILVNGGTAKLVATPGKDPKCFDTYANACSYKSGLLSTARKTGNDADYLYSFTYGYVEANLKLPAQTPGFFTAFWMLPANKNFSYRSEIDIIEVLGYDSSTPYMTYHGLPDRNTYFQTNGVSNCPKVRYDNALHRFGLDWQPNYIAWYVDGVKCAQYNGSPSTIENGPMQIILNLMVDVDWERDWGQGLKDPTLTRQLEVDYIRVWQQR